MKDDRLFVLSVKPTFVSGTDIESCRENPINFCICYSLKLFFDFCYFLCISPFRLVWDKTTHSYFIHCFLPQKLFCAFITVLYLIPLCSSLRHEYPNNPKSSNQIFTYFKVVFFVIFRLNFLKILWLNQLQIKNLINFILKSNFQFVVSYWHRIFFSKGVQILVLAFQLALILVSFITGHRLFPDSFQVTQLSLSTWSSQVLTSARRALFLKASDQSAQISKYQQAWSASDYFLFLVGSFGFLYRHIHILLSEFYLYLLSAVMWCCTSSFAVHTLRYCKSWMTLKQNYKLLASLAAHINHSLSTLAFWWLTGSIFYFSLNVDIMFLKQSTTGALQLHRMFITLYWLVTGFLFSFACGQSCSNVSIILKYIIWTCNCTLK